MTPEERTSIQRLGGVLGRNIISPAAFFLFFGAATGLFAIWVHLNLGRGLGTPQRKIILVTMVVTYALHAVTTVDSVLVLKAQIRGALVHRVSTATINKTTTTYFIMSSWAEQIQLIINDGIVVWRAWILYPGQKWVKIALCFLLAAAIGLSVPSLILTITPAAGLLAAPGTVTLSKVFDNISFCSSFVTNLVATLLILHKLRVQRHSHILNLGQKRSMTRGQRVLLVLVESGLVFCGLQAMDLALLFIPSSPSSDIAFFVFGNTCFWATMPLFPFIVIIMVQKNNSVVETFGFSDRLRDIAADVERALDGSTADPVPEDSPIILAGAKNAYLGPKEGPWGSRSPSDLP